jgi:hypothetical protein
LQQVPGGGSFPVLAVLSPTQDKIGGEAADVRGADSPGFLLISPTSRQRIQQTERARQETGRKRSNISRTPIRSDGVKAANIQSEAGPDVQEPQLRDIGQAEERRQGIGAVNARSRPTTRKPRLAR